MKNRKSDSSAKLAAPHLSLQWTHRDDIDLLMWLCKATNKSSCSVNKSHLIGETYKKQWNNTLIWYVRMPLPALLSAPFLLTPRLHSSLWEFFSPSFCLLLTLTLFQTRVNCLMSRCATLTQKLHSGWLMCVSWVAFFLLRFESNYIPFSIISGLYCLSEAMKLNQVSSCHCDYIQYTRFPCWMTGFRK